MKGRFHLEAKFDSLEQDSLYISEITLAELKFGVANSKRPERNKAALDDFLSGIKVLPIFDSLDIFANEKARLRSLGQPVDDFDLCVGDCKRFNAHNQ